MALEWDEHRDTIVRLYSLNTLTEVVRIMAEDYDFHADRRTYYLKFEEWGIGKRHNSGRMNVLDNVPPVPAGHVGRASQYGESSASGAFLDYAGTESTQVDGYHGAGNAYAEYEAAGQSQSQIQATDGSYDLHGHHHAPAAQGQYYPAVDAHHYYNSLPSAPLGTHGAQASHNVSAIPQPAAQPYGQNVSANPLPPPQNRVLRSNGRAPTGRTSKRQS